jgi:tetratricopeptide (TPR) repeat protein
MRKLVWLSLLAVLIIGCGTSSPQITQPTPLPPAAATPAPAAAVAASAVDLSAELNTLKTGDTKTAIADLEKILANNPASAEAHLLLGQALYRDGQTDKAVEQFQAAFTLNATAKPPLESQDADEWLKIGNAHALLGQLEEALTAYQTALQIKPDKSAAYTNIGVVYYQSGKFDEAVQQMQKALAIDPNDAETHYMLGATYVQQQKFDEAEKAFNQAIELKPDLAAAYTGLGNVQLARQNFAEAADTLLKATELQPDQAEAWLALGQAYAAQGNQPEANKALQECLRLSQANPQFATLSARCQQLSQQLGTP